jgi:cell division septal protein FtsQ
MPSPEKRLLTPLEELAFDGEARRRRRWRRSALTLGSTVLVLALLVFLESRISPRPLWTVDSVEVEGNRSISTADLLARLQVGPGTPWWRVNRVATRRLLASTPRVSGISLRWRWPRDLVVAVAERESILRLPPPSSLEMAADGMLMEPCEALDPIDLPLLTGSLPGALASGRACDLPAAGPSWREILTLGKENPTLWKEISQIDYLGNQDFEIFLRRGHKVIFWSAGINHDLKKQLPGILAELRGQQVEDAVLDLRFKDQAVVRLPESALADSSSVVAPVLPTPPAQVTSPNHASAPPGHASTPRKHKTGHPTTRRRA